MDGLMEVTKEVGDGGDVGMKIDKVGSLGSGSDEDIADGRVSAPMQEMLFSLKYLAVGAEGPSCATIRTMKIGPYTSPVQKDTLKSGSGHTGR